MDIPVNDDEILSKVKKIIFEAMRVDPDKITSEARLFTDLGAESLDVLDIRFRIQESFGFQISDGEVIRRLGNNLTAKEIEDKFTVLSLVDYINERLSQKEV